MSGLIYIDLGREAPHKVYARRLSDLGKGTMFTRDPSEERRYRKTYLEPSVALLSDHLVEDLLSRMACYGRSRQDSLLSGKDALNAAISIEGKS